MSRTITATLTFSTKSPLTATPQKPVLLNINKDFSEWSGGLPHAACVVVLVDRLVRRAEVVEIEAETYGLNEAKELSAAGPELHRLGRVLHR